MVYNFSLRSRSCALVDDRDNFFLKKHVIWWLQERCYFPKGRNLFTSMSTQGVIYYQQIEMRQIQFSFSDDALGIRFREAQSDWRQGMDCAVFVKPPPVTSIDGLHEFYRNVETWLNNRGLYRAHDYSSEPAIKGRTYLFKSSRDALMFKLSFVGIGSLPQD